MIFGPCIQMLTSTTKYIVYTLSQFKSSMKKLTDNAILDQEIRNSSAIMDLFQGRPIEEFHLTPQVIKNTRFH